MDNLDALLNELHQTNVELLKKNKAADAYSKNNNNTVTKPIPDSLRPTETDLDEPSLPGGYASSDSPINLNEPSATSAGLHYDWSAILDNLDSSEYAGLANGYSFPPDDSRSSSIKSPVTLNHAKDRNGTDCTYELSSLTTPEEQSRETRRAAEQAAKQLDDLLHSLGQFKLDGSQSNHKHAPTDGSDTIDLNQTDFFPETDNTVPAVYYNAAPGPTSSRSQPANGRLHRQDARRNGTSQKNNIDTKNGKLPEHGHAPMEPTHVLSDMLSNLSSELAQQGAITSPKGFCYACRKPIVGMLISAMDKEWHPDHFTCAECGTGLVRMDFYERDNKPYCLDCHARLFSPKCAYCGEAILEKCIVALSRAWHPEHFFCYGCHTGFNDSVTVHEHEDKVYCPTCYLDRFGTRCLGCNKPITDSYITALKAPWHRTCFVCQDCGKPLSGSNFHEADGYPLCEAHYYTRRGLICSTCSKPITGRCVNALGKRYHPIHFVCAYCLQPLQSGTFKEHSNKPYCHQCFAQLFG